MLFKAELETRRVKSEITLRNNYQDDCRASLTIQGTAFSDATADMKYENMDIYAQLDAFHAFCNSAKGRNWNDWDHIATESSTHVIGGNFTELPTVDGNLLKATLLLYLWCESAIVTQNPSALYDLLYDEFILDYTGTVGPQNHVYFLPQSLTKEETKNAREKLYELSILSRLTVQFDKESLCTYFTPLRLPMVGIHSFETDTNYKYWTTVKAHMARKLRLYAEGQNYAT